MLKTTSHGITSYHAEKRCYTPPVIVDSFSDDLGELQYVLANGHTTPATMYNALWNPPKGTVKGKFETKGDRIDSKQRIY